MCLLDMLLVRVLVSVQHSIESLDTLLTMNRSYGQHIMDREDGEVFARDGFEVIIRMRAQSFLLKSCTRAYIPNYLPLFL